MKWPTAIFISPDGWRRNMTGSSDPQWAPPFFLALKEDRYYDLVGWCWGRPVYRQRPTPNG